MRARPFLALGWKVGNDSALYALEFGTNSVQLRERKNGFLASKRQQMKHLDFLILLLESGCCSKPLVKCTSHPIRNRNGSDMASLAHQIDDGPVFFPLLKDDPGSMPRLRVFSTHTRA